MTTTETTPAAAALCGNAQQYQRPVDQIQQSISAPSPTVGQQRLAGSPSRQGQQSQSSGNGGQTSTGDGNINDERFKYLRHIPFSWVVVSNLSDPTQLVDPRRRHPARIELDMVVHSPEWLDLVSRSTHGSILAHPANLPVGLLAAADLSLIQTIARKYGGGNLSAVSWRHVAFAVQTGPGSIGLRAVPFFSTCMGGGRDAFNDLATVYVYLAADIGPLQCVIWGERCPYPRPPTSTLTSKMRSILTAAVTAAETLLGSESESRRRLHLATAQQHSLPAHFLDEQRATESRFRAERLAAFQNQFYTIHQQYVQAVAEQAQEQERERQDRWRMIREDESAQQHRDAEFQHLLAQRVEQHRLAAERQRAYEAQQRASAELERQRLLVEQHLEDLRAQQRRMAAELERQRQVAEEQQAAADAERKRLVAEREALAAQVEQQRASVEQERHPTPKPAGHPSPNRPTVDVARKIIRSAQTVSKRAASTQQFSLARPGTRSSQSRVISALNVLHSTQRTSSSAGKKTNGHAELLAAAAAPSADASPPRYSLRSARSSDSTAAVAALIQSDPSSDGSLSPEPTKPSQVGKCTTTSVSKSQASSQRQPQSRPLATAARQTLNRQWERELNAEATRATQLATEVRAGVERLARLGLPPAEDENRGSSAKSSTPEEKASSSGAGTDATRSPPPPPRVEMDPDDADDGDSLIRANPEEWRRQLDRDFNRAMRRSGEVRQAIQQMNPLIFKWLEEDKRKGLGFGDRG